MANVEGASARSFRGTDGAAEHFLVVQAPAERSWAGQVAAVEERYHALRQALDLGPESAIFRRVFLSDAQNQAAAVAAGALAGTAEEGPVAFSIIEQPPLPGGKIALFAYHLEGGGRTVKRRVAPHHLRVERNGFRHLWSSGLCAGAALGPVPAAVQTRHVFAELTAALARERGCLRDHCVRTWIYVKDVDVFYPEMVASRRALLAAAGLTAETHYIASTATEGACADRYDLVAMDAYSLPDLQPGQRRELNDLAYLCATHDYEVTFERATRIGYADRAHLFLSGTASIDPAGLILHEGDVLRQLDRAIENVAALLRAGGAGLSDLMHLLVYLRDPTDFAAVDARLRARFPALPIQIVAGAVCRPGWLVEVEGIAITATSAPDLPPF